MLNKELCKKCVSDRSTRGWAECDENNWNRGIIYCLNKKQLIIDVGDINENPPKNCIYILEHILKLDENTI